MPLVLDGTNGVSGVDGTASNPAIEGTDSNTGIFYPAADTVAIGTGGTERLRVDSAGNVGIGTTSPALPIDVISNSSSLALSIRGRSSDDIGTLMYYTNNGVTNTAQIQMRPNDNEFRFAALGARSQTFYTNGSERARITSGGYFKASDNGTYYGSGQPYHELRSSASSLGVAITTPNASYANEVIRALVTRAQTSAYQFFCGYSNDGSDLEFNLRGDGNGYADGTWNNNGADYAEFFESVTGAALTLGATVVLDGNKVREATDQDPVSAIMGVVRPKEPSKASMIVGNTAWNKWANKYLTDDFDRYIMEDHDVVEWTDEDGKQHSYESHNIPAGVTVPDDAIVKTHDDKGNKFQHYKLNPAWNPDAEYVNRENRPEWIIVGLVGQVKVLKGQPVNDRWIKMRDVSETVEEWMIR